MAWYHIIISRGGVARGGGRNPRRACMPTFHNGDEVITFPTSAKYCGSQISYYREMVVIMIMAYLDMLQWLDSNSPRIYSEEHFAIACHFYSK